MYSFFVANTHRHSVHTHTPRLQRNIFMSFCLLASSIHLSIFFNFVPIKRNAWSHLTERERVSDTERSVFSLRKLNNLKRTASKSICFMFDSRHTQTHTTVGQTWQAIVGDKSFCCIWPSCRWWVPIRVCRWQSAQSDSLNRNSSTLNYRLWLHFFFFLFFLLFMPSQHRASALHMRQLKFKCNSIVDVDQPLMP